MGSSGADVKLICLDFDGTIIETDAVHYWIADDVVSLLNELGERGIRWCSNSGRSRENQLGVVQACRSLTNMPIAILSAEREIYWCAPEAKHHEPFNTRLEKMVWALKPRVEQALEPYMDSIRSKFEIVKDLVKFPVVGWALSDNDQATALSGYLRGLLTDMTDAQVMRNGTWVVVTHAEVGKGIVLEEAARHLGIDRENILAVGDWQNDLDMLDGRVAANVGCPSDADPEILAAVRKANGHVSQLPSHQGTIEVIRHFT